MNEWINEWMNDGIENKIPLPYTYQIQNIGFNTFLEILQYTCPTKFKCQTSLVILIAT
jgi:hypothetical protein